jgi:hypothetical protein
MLINFVENTKGNGVIGTHPTGLVVFADFTDTGTFDVMFTGVSKTGKALFCTKIPQEGVKKVHTKSGFSVRGSMCSTSAGATDEAGAFVMVYPGKLDRCLFVADHLTTSVRPTVGGTLYVNMYKGEWRGCGVEDIWLLSALTLEHAPGYKQKLKDLTPRVGQLYEMTTYDGSKVYCEITGEGDNWHTAKAFHKSLNAEVYIDLCIQGWVRCN